MVGGAGMRVNLLNGYYIEIDSMNYTLMQKYIGKDKDGNPKEAVRVLGYFTTLKGAVDKYLKVTQLDEMADTSMEMEEYVKKVEESNKMAVQAIKRVMETKGEEHETD